MTMELEFERDTIVCYETLTEVTLCQEETLESIVPDACPDILRIVDVCGQATLSSKAAKEGMAVVTGMCRAAPYGGGTSIYLSGRGPRAHGPGICRGQSSPALR